MLKGLETVEAQLGRTYPLVIGCARVETGDLPELRTRVNHLFINGKQVDLTSKHTRLTTNLKTGSNSFAQSKKAEGTTARWCGCPFCSFDTLNVISP